MAASITLSAPVLASDGKTLTATIGGGDGTYSPSSGITTLIVKVSTTRYFIASTAVASTTLTINLDTFVPSGATVTLDIGSGSNLTDASLNTATGQTAVACTNNSTQAQTTFADTDANFYFFNSSLPGSVSSRTYRQFAVYTTGDRFETVLTGTDASILVWASGTTTVTIDDGTPVTYSALNASQWSWIKLFSGLSDTPHNVKVKTAIVDRVSIVALKGAAPATSSPAGYGTILTVGAAPLSTYSAIDGNYTSSTVEGHANTIQWTYGSGVFRFTAAVTDVWVYTNQLSGRLKLLRDGIEVGHVDGSGADIWEMLHIGTGLSTAQANYEILACARVTNAPYLWAVMLGGGTGLVSQTQAAPRDIWGFYGDSITVAFDGLTPPAPPYDTTEVNSWILARSKGAVPTYRGAGGQPVSTYGRDNTAFMTGLSPAPKKVFIQFGTNDQALTMTALATFKADYKTMLANLRTGLPSASIYAVGIFPSTRSGTFTIAQYNAQIIAGVAEIADANMFYIDSDGIFDPNDIPVSSDDGVHPTAHGYSLIASREYLGLFPVAGFGTRL